MERERIGGGWEHEVYKSRREGWVLKRPKLPVILVNNLMRFDARDVRDDLRQAQAVVGETSFVDIPTSRIFEFNGSFLGVNYSSYIIVQRYVKEDGSVTDIENQLRTSGQEYLANRYTIMNENFVSNMGKLFLVDFTRTYKRALGKMKIPYAEATRLHSNLIKLFKRDR